MSDESASIETTPGDVALNEIKSALIDNPNLSLDEKRRIMARVRDEFGPHLGAANEVDHLTYLRQLVEVGASPDEIKRWRRVMEAAKTNDERRKCGRELRGWIHKKRRDLARVRDDIDRREARAARMRTAALEIDGWIGGPFQMQRPRGSMLHKLQKAFLDDEAYVVSNINEDPVTILDDLNQTWSTAQVFVIEHDWARALAGANDIAGGDFKLPHDICVFELRYNDHPVVITAFSGDIELEADKVFLTPAICASTGWIINGAIALDASGNFYAWTGGDGPMTTGINGTLRPMPRDDKLIVLLREIAAQIRAVSIALEAEVATTSAVRAEHRSNREPRGQHRLPAYSYNVVSLARRQRPDRLPTGDDHDKRRSPRLHFRRGHWRHYQDHKTWLKWTLVGDPDLGFVDKHYKL